MCRPHSYIKEHLSMLRGSSTASRIPTLPGGARLYTLDDAPLASTSAHSHGTLGGTPHGRLQAAGAVDGYPEDMGAHQAGHYHRNMDDHHRSEGARIHRHMVSHRTLVAHHSPRGPVRALAHAPSWRDQRNTRHENRSERCNHHGPGRVRSTKTGMAYSTAQPRQLKSRAPHTAMQALKYQRFFACSLQE